MMVIYSYNYFGLGTKYNTLPINILDVIAFYHDVDYENAKNKDDYKISYMIPKKKKISFFFLRIY